MVGRVIRSGMDRSGHTRRHAERVGIRAANRLACSKRDARCVVVGCGVAGGIRASQVGQAPARWEWIVLCDGVVPIKDRERASGRQGVVARIGVEGEVTDSAATRIAKVLRAHHVHRRLCPRPVGRTRGCTVDLRKQHRERRTREAARAKASPPSGWVGRALCEMAAPHDLDSTRRGSVLRRAASARRGDMERHRDQ